MAKPLTGDPGSPEETKKLNAKAREALINTTVREIKALDGQIKTLQAKRREIVNKNIKGDLGRKVANFAAAFRLYDLDEEQLEEFIDTFRELMKALGKAKQLSMLATMSSGTADPSSDQQEAGYTFAAGRDAGLDGKNADTNPHTAGTPQHDKWHEGWLKGQSDLVAAQHGGGNKGAKNRAAAAAH